MYWARSLMTAPARMACAALIAVGLVVGSAAPSQAVSFTSSLGIDSGFVDPGGWSVGDAGSTHQIWNAKTASLGNLPDQGYNVAGATLTAPTHSVKSPGFGPTSTGNFYSFSGDFGATADIYNHGGSSSLGTHVIVQIGASLNPDEESFPGHGTGVFLDSLKIVDLSDAALAGGDNPSSLQISEISYEEGVSSTFGPVDYQELIYEFFLPNYTGDFRVDWDQKVHATIDTLRVDSMIAPQAFSLTGVSAVTTPEPSSMLLCVLGGLTVAAMSRRRRRRT
jgi:hypothetical protein